MLRASFSASSGVGRLTSRIPNSRYAPVGDALRFRSVAIPRLPLVAGWMAPPLRARHLSSLRPPALAPRSASVASSSLRQPAASCCCLRSSSAAALSPVRCAQRHSPTVTGNGWRLTPPTVPDSSLGAYAPRSVSDVGTTVPPSLISTKYPECCVGSPHTRNKNHFKWFLSASKACVLLSK